MNVSFSVVKEINVSVKLAQCYLWGKRENSRPKVSAGTR